MARASRRKCWGWACWRRCPRRKSSPGPIPTDVDGDDITARLQVVWSDVHNRPMPGRFGLIAGNPPLLKQTASAFAGNIGISNPIHPAASGECRDAQTDRMAALHGDEPEQGGFELDEVGLEHVTFYSSHLAVPARREVDDPQVLHGWSTRPAARLRRRATGSRAIRPAAFG